MEVVCKVEGEIKPNPYRVCIVILSVVMSFRIYGKQKFLKQLLAVNLHAEGPLCNTVLAGIFSYTYLLHGAESFLSS